MERKYHGLKKTIIILAVVAVLLVAAIVYCQIRLKNVKANEEKKWQDHLTSRQEELDKLQAEYDAKGYDATKDELKDKEKALKDELKELEKAAKDAEATPAPTEKPAETEAPEEDATEEPAETAKSDD